MNASQEHKPFAKEGKGGKNHPNKHLTTPHPETCTRGTARKHG